MFFFFLFFMFDHAVLFSLFDFSVVGELYPWCFVQCQRGTSSLSLELYFIILGSANVALNALLAPSLRSYKEIQTGGFNLFLMGAQLLTARSWST